MLLTVILVVSVLGKEHDMKVKRKKSPPVDRLKKTSVRYYNRLIYISLHFTYGIGVFVSVHLKLEPSVLLQCD